MGLKDKMMEGMMNGMSAEEKKEMMDKMMNSFFSGMSDEEKQAMMGDMMSKMMGPKSGEGGGMMGMMQSMMGGKGQAEKGFNPMDMCRNMMGSFQETAASAKFATPEVRNLFEEWAVQIEDEIHVFIQKENEINLEKISEHFKLSKESVIYFLKRLADKNKIKFCL